MQTGFRDIKTRHGNDGSLKVRKGSTQYGREKFTKNQNVGCPDKMSGNPYFS